MITDNVLTAAYLLECKPSKSVVDSLTRALSKMDMNEWGTLKRYIQNGTFLLEKGDQQ